MIHFNRMLRPSNMKLNTKRLDSCRGMTLVEVMIAMTLGIIVIAAATDFLVEATRATLKATNNTSNDLTAWDIYAQVSIDSKVANGMAIYKDFTKPSFDPVSGTNLRKNTGSRGDFLVLTNSTQNTFNGAALISNVVGFVYDSTTQTFKRFDFPIASPNTDSVEKILTDNYAFLGSLCRVMAKDVTATIINPDPANPQNPDPADSNKRAFLCRDRGKQSGVLNIQLKTASGNQSNYKLIEAAFVIRQ